MSATPFFQRLLRWNIDETPAGGRFHPQGRQFAQQGRSRSGVLSIFVKVVCFPGIAFQIEHLPRVSAIEQLVALIADGELFHTGSRIRAQFGEGIHSPRRGLVTA